MSKSSTEQFQIKKKRKHPLSGAATSIVAATLPNNPPSEIHQFASKRYATAATSDVLIKENFCDFQLGDKHLKHSLHFKPITSAEEAADIFIDFEYIAAAADLSIVAVADSSSGSIADRTATAATNCLRDQTQVQLLRESHAPKNVIVNSNYNNNNNNNSATIMPLQHGFYVKGALASKRALKSLRSHNFAATSNPASGEEVKRPRRTLATSAAAENAKLRSQAFMVGQTPNNIQFSYLLGESLARHGRLQEAFDIYALIASEQLEGFIPLEKLNILATALLEHIRILSSNSKKSTEMLAADISSQASQFSNSLEQGDVASSVQYGKFSPGVGSSSKALASQSSPVATNLDLHNPTRELARTKSPSLTEDYDPLLCPLCRDILRYPVTANCGHTFCRQCCETITMCNICHIKFPRWQKDEIPVEASGPKHDNITTMTTLSTATSTTTSSSSSNLTPTVQYISGNQQSIYTFPTNAASADMSSAALLSERPRLRIVTSPSQAALAPSPTTVTTTSIACTTDTATTTMASTSSLLTNSGGRGGSNSNDNMKFMPDVLVRRLVEKWWGAELQAKKILETATSYMHLNLLDDALKFCNVSLEKSPSNFKSLLLRAEVLRKMSHYQSSLADVDNALKSRYTSAKAHYLRSLAISDLSRYEEALYEICLAISLDKSTNLSNTELFQHDLTKILQKLLSQTPKCIKLDLVSVRPKCPYGSEHRLRRKNITVQDEATLHPYEEEDFLSVDYGKECDILADDDVLTCTDFLNCADKRTTYASIAKKYEMELKRQTSPKHFRRKWQQRVTTELLPAANNEVEESVRCSGQFRNVLERLQEEIERLRKIESSPEYALKQRISVGPSLIDVSDFDCVLCCRTFWKPVVTPCGHTYCLVCLDRCMDYTSSCPLCMSPLVESSVNMHQGASSPVPLVLTKRPVTKFLEAAMKRFIPDSYNKRFRQERVMESSVPIFICTTAFPYVPCPLFVYEHRYRLMVRRAVESGEKQFGIVQPHSGKTRYYDYGCILDIRDCVLLGGGCTILSTLGCKRFKILARNEKDGYETAKVEYIHDEAIPEEHLTYVTRMHDIVLEKAISWYESLGEDLKHEILQSYGEMPLVEDNWSTRDDGPAWAWWIIALLPLRPQLKVDILATTSLEKRLRAIEKTIHSMPGNYHYQRVSQNCNVAVVVRQQQHHDLDNTSPHHRHHHRHHRHARHHDNDIDVVDIDNENDDIVDDVDDDDEEQVALQHHIHNMDDDEVDENDQDIDDIEHHDRQQHVPHMQSHHHLQLHHHHHHHQQQQLHHNSLQHQQHCENVTNADECCQRTTTTQQQQEAEQAQANSELQQQQQQLHHHHQQHHTAHTHSLLL